MSLQCCIRVLRVLSCLNMSSKRIGRNTYTIHDDTRIVMSREADLLRVIGQSIYYLLIYDAFMVHLHMSCIYTSSIR